MVRDGRKRTTLLNLMMKDGFGDWGIETGVCRGPLSPFTVGCVRRGGIDADITASEMAAGRKPIKRERGSSLQKFFRTTFR